MEGSFSAVSQQNEWHPTPDSQSPLYITEKYFQTVDHISNQQQQQLPHENSSLFGCMLGADATCRESDLRNWRLRNQVASLVNSQFGNFFVLVSLDTAIYFFAQDLVVMSCMFPWILPPYFFAQDPPLFPRIGIRLESNPDDRVFYVHEFVLHSSSKFYEGLVGFYAEQPQQGGPAANGRSSAQITIPAECLTDARCALPVWNCAARMLSGRVRARPALY